MNVYYDPEKFGLKIIGEIEWSDGCWQFDTTVVWQREADGVFLYAEDSGCSCPMPFERIGINDMIQLADGINGLNDFKAAMEARDAAAYCEPGSRGPKIVALLERIHEAMRGSDD